MRPGQGVAASTADAPRKPALGLPGWRAARGTWEHEREWGELQEEAALWRGREGVPLGLWAGPGREAAGSWALGHGRPLCVPALAPPAPPPPPIQGYAFKPPPRPDFGTSGRTIKLQANFFDPRGAGKDLPILGLEELRGGGAAGGRAGPGVSASGCEQQGRRGAEPRALGPQPWNLGV